MKFLDQTGATELITLVKKALKPLESMKSSITDVNGIVKSDGSGGFSAATAGTDYAAASHNHAASSITSGTLPIVRGGTGATTASYALTSLGAQAKAKTLTLSLSVAGWSATSKTQTSTATGVTADNIVIVSPAPGSQEAYATAGVKCTAQEASSLTFTCDTVPTEALSVNVVIL